MATTIIEWLGSDPFTQEVIERNIRDAEALAGPEYRLGKTTVVNEAGNTVVTRDWPSLENAQAWVAHQAQWNPVSAVASPD